MFTKHIPRTGNPVGSTHSVFTRVGAVVTALALSSGFALVAAPAAQADTVPASWAQAKFLSGSLLGTDLSDVAELQPAEVSNMGDQEKQTQDDPLRVNVLHTVPIGTGQGVQLTLGDFLQSGALGQFAEAESNGSSMAATGAVGNDGGVAVGQSGQRPNGDLSLNLSMLLDQTFSDVISDLKLNLSGITSQAVAQASEASGSYVISGATLTFTSPAVAQLKEKVTTALDAVDSNLATVGSDDGTLGNAVDAILDPVLAPTGASANVKVSIDSNLHEVVNDILKSQYGTRAVTFDLETGEVRVNLKNLLGGSLNSLAPNTEILSDTVMNQVLKGITDTVSIIADQIVDKARETLHTARVTMTADLDLLTPQSGGTTTQCHVVDLPVVQNILGDVLGGNLGSVSELLDIPGVTKLSDLKTVLTSTQVTQLTQALGVTDLGQLDNATTAAQLNKLLTSSVGSGGGLRGLAGLGRSNRSLAQQTPCETVGTLLPDRHSTANVTVIGTVDDLINGTAATATAAISLLDGTIPVSFDAGTLVPALGSGLEATLFGDNGSVQKLTTALNAGLVNPAVTGLLGDGDSVSTVLTDLVSLKANVQELTPVNGGMMFTETALRLTVDPALENATQHRARKLAHTSSTDGSTTAAPAASTARVARVNLAQSSVGPNAQTVNPPTCTDGTCTPCTGNGCTNNPNPDPCFTDCGTTIAGVSRLAYTGVGIATLIAIILALLAAGAYLAREGYRRNHTKSLTSD